MFRGHATRERERNTDKQIDRQTVCVRARLLACDLVCSKSDLVVFIMIALQVCALEYPYAYVLNPRNGVSSRGQVS